MTPKQLGTFHRILFGILLFALLPGSLHAMDRPSVRDMIGEDHIFWELDYPHADTPWPNTQKVTPGSICGLTSSCLSVDPSALVAILNIATQAGLTA